MSRKDSYQKQAKANKSKKTYNDTTKKEVVEVKNKDKEKTYRNPANSVVGKVIIFVLAALMCFSGLFALVYYIITKG